MTLISPIDPSIRRPGTFLKMLFGVGPRSAGGARKVLLFGNKLAAGTATVEEVVFVPSRDDASTLFGPGSELHLQAKAAFKANPNVQLYAIPIAESAGAQATGILTITGAATSAGTIRVVVNGREVLVPFASADDPTAVATAIAAKVNQETDWPVTAGFVLGVVTLTAKQIGPRGNVLTYRSELVEGSGIVTTDTASELAGGTTADDAQNAIDAIAGERYHILVPAAFDATELAKFETHLDTEADPTSGRREQLVGASVDTLANATVIATGRNEARMSILWHFNAEVTPAELAACGAARKALRDSQDPAYNYDGEGLPGIPIQRSVADRPSNTEIESALANGLTPVGATGDGEATVTRWITSRSQDASSNPDDSVLDVSKVTVPDAFADDLQVGFPAQFGGWKAANDPAPGDKPPPPRVLTPEILKSWIFSLLTDYERDAKITNVNALKTSLEVELATSPAGQFIATIPIDVIEGAHQFAAGIRQVG